MSRLRLSLVICACILFWAALGALLGGLFRHSLGGLIWGLLFGIGYVVFGSWAAEKFPLDVWDAQLLENSTAPNFYEMMHALGDKTGLPLPTLYSIPRPEPNAFVTADRDGDTSIIVTNGLTHHLEKDEVQAVMALMVARLATEAMPAWTIGATLAGLPLHLGRAWQQKPGLRWLGTAMLSVFAYPSAGLARLAWDEGVVTASDYHAAHLAENPGALARALAKIEAGRTEAQVQAGNPATAFLFAVPPLPPPPPASPFWRRALDHLPFRRPDAAARAARLQDIVLPAKTPELLEPAEAEPVIHSLAEPWG